DHLAVSMHSTAMRLGKTSDRSALSVYEMKEHHYFDHLRIADLWSEAFGRENLICRIYDRARLTNGDVVSDICGLVGIQHARDPDDYSGNESVSGETMNVLSLLNGSTQSKNDTLRQQILAIGKGRGGKKTPMMTRAEAQKFMKQFDEGNREFFKRYVDP